jgi:PAS domain S-box-containing protein
MGEKDFGRELAFRAFHRAPQLMAISNLETGEFVDVNEAFLRVLGYDKKSIIGCTSDDIEVFADIEESNKYIKLLAKFSKVTDFPVSLRTRNRETKPFLFSAEVIALGDEKYLLTVFNEIHSHTDRILKTASEQTVNEIFETVSTYMILFSVSGDNKFVIRDINSKASDIESITREVTVGKNVSETALSSRIKLLELLHHIRITGDPHKLAASVKGDSSEGYYMGFPISNGDIVVTWEPDQSDMPKRGSHNTLGSLTRKVIPHAPEMIYELDLNGRIVYANTQGLNYFGYEPADLHGSFTIKDLFPPDQFEKVIQNLGKIDYNNQHTNNEYLARKKDGTLIPINTRTFGVFEGTELKAYRGIVADISVLKRDEEEIIREKAFLEHLIDSTPEAIIITDIPGKISLINKEFTNLFGYTYDEAINRYIDELIVPEDLRDEALEIENNSSRVAKQTIQTVRQTKDGTRLDVSLIASNIVISDVTVAHLGIYRDITSDRKRQQLQEILYNISNAALKQLDIKEIYPTIVAELSKIWDTNNFYIAIFDKQSNTISLPFFSDEKDDFNDIPIEGTITGWVIRSNSPVLLKVDDLRKLEEKGEIDLVGTPCKVWMGVPLNVESETIGVMCLQDYNSEDKFSDEDLNVLDFIAKQIAIAIQRRTMLDNMIQARQKAEEAAQSKQLFMSTMSHEIRTPLNEVIGISNLLMQSNPTEEQSDLIKTLRFSANHLMTLVNDVLDYNKMESGKIVFEQTQFNLTDFLDEMRRSYSFRAHEKKLKFNIERSQDVVSEVIGDQIRLNQVLSNLLSNALKFTISGSINVYVRELERTGNLSKIEFTVKDTGIGIPAEKHEDIFESFTQASTDTTRRFGGTGLGLAICKRLVELQGGTIRVESVPGNGSSFIFTLIFGIAEQQVVSRTASLSDNLKGLEGKRVLVAEDNKINFFVANKFLVSWGILVTHVENGQLALEMVNKEEFDLILMDLHMPILDGIEASRIIRNSANPRISSIPIVALTAAIMSESHDRIEGLNINDYVLKPFKPQDLYERILRHAR